MPRRRRAGGVRRRPTGVLAALRRRGFDTSYHIPFTREFHVGCSQCAALAICGVACHETGCPNQRRAREEEADD